MCEQLERLLREMDLPSLGLRILPADADFGIVPMPGFNMGEDRAHYELVSCGVDVTAADELALHHKAFDALSGAACHGDSARGLISKALAFWRNA